MLFDTSFQASYFKKHFCLGYHRKKERGQLSSPVLLVNLWCWSRGYSVAEIFQIVLCINIWTVKSKSINTCKEFPLRKRNKVFPPYYCCKFISCLIVEVILPFHCLDFECKFRFHDQQEEVFALRGPLSIFLLHPPKCLWDCWDIPEHHLKRPSSMQAVVSPAYAEIACISTCPGSTASVFLGSFLHVFCTFGFWGTLAF